MDSLLDLAATRQPEPVFTMAETARALRISDSYLSKLIAKGRAERSIRTASGRMLFSRQDVERLARQLGREDRLAGKAA